MTGAAADDLGRWLRALPKADLHLHLLGALRLPTLVELARRRASPVLAAAEEAVAGGLSFPDLPAFVGFFIGLFDLVLDAPTFERVAFEALEDAAVVGTRYAELRVTPTSHVARGADEDELFAGLEAGRRAADKTFGIASRVVVDFPRSLPVAVAEEALEVALRQRRRGVTGLDIAGDEVAVGADARFADVFRRARAAGLHVTAHAGEGAGPESVAGALDRYGARRIGHGTRSVEDPALVSRLARDGVVLEVCVTSNEVLGVVPDVRRHPVRAFLEAGVACVPCTDDPTLFGTDLHREYRRWHEELAVPLPTLGALAAAGLEAAFLEPGPSGLALAERLADHAAAARSAF